ncbi:MAG TPA: HAD hydrolase-like protein, partial [Corynebacterium sp.]|nr:HAD hydrolase-like protein [Corynebacterium sp.]
IFLDVDGTVIDSFPGIRAGFLHALDTVGVEHPAEVFTARIPGPPMEHTLGQLMPAQLVPVAFDAYMEFTRNGGWSQAEPFPGLVDLVRRLSAAGFYLATATSKGEGFARRILDRIGVLGHIDFLGAAEEYGDRRSKTAVISHVLDSVGLSGRTSDILMVGDRSHDIEGAAHFGIDTVAVTWGYGEDTEWAQAAYTATTVTELEAIINDWSGSGQGSTHAH